MFASVFGAPVAIASASFTLIFSLRTGIVKQLLIIARNKKKKHNKILMLARSKLNSIESLISEALIDLQISHEEYMVIFKEINMKKWNKMWKMQVIIQKKQMKIWDWPV